MEHTQNSLIFIVDDNLQLLKTLELTFLGRGYRVLTSTSGDEAVTILHGDYEPDVLLTDAVMPGEHQGQDVALAFKDVRPLRPVIMMSGYVNWEDLTPAERSAIDHFVPKPFRLAEITAVVTEALCTASRKPDQQLAVGY